MRVNNQLTFLYEGEETRRLDDILSLERLQRYLEAARGDRETAYRLYALNTAVAEALYSPIQMLEVALRNRFHAALSDVYGEEWFDHLGVINNVFQRHQIGDAKINLVRDRKPIEPSRIIASLSFGFWTACLGRQYEQMWRQALFRSFKNAPKGTKRSHLNQPLTKIRLLRNRIAHHEPILQYNLPERHAQILEVTRWLSSTASDWTRRHSRFHDVYGDDLAKLFRNDNHPKSPNG